MTAIEFAADEAEVLREMLRRSIDEIEVEVFRTDTHDFKERLKRRREIMEQILGKLSVVTAGA